MKFRTGITTVKGFFGVFETCNKHKIVWKEGEENPNECCMDCIIKARPTRYRRKYERF
jgi:hypothetical protein